jgi:small subunit ribosomal protein S18
MPFKKDKAKRNDVKSAPRAKKFCYFCDTKKEPTYTDSALLKKYMSDRSRIVGRIRSGICSKHQRVVTKHIKYARHLALLPFIAKV